MAAYGYVSLSPALYALILFHIPQLHAVLLTSGNPSMRGCISSSLFQYDFRLPC